jgi:hypothetical protein
MLEETPQKKPRVEPAAFCIVSGQTPEPKAGQPDSHKKTVIKVISGGTKHDLSPVVGKHHR